jgi:hypothetical protein
MTYQDTFKPTLMSAESLAFPVSVEQKLAIKEILRTACSDTRFAEKAYDAIEYVLTTGPAPLLRKSDEETKREEKEKK